MTAHPASGNNVDVQLLLDGAGCYDFANGKNARQWPFKIKNVLMKQGGRSEGFHCSRSATRLEKDLGLVKRTMLEMTSWRKKWMEVQS